MKVLVTGSKGMLGQDLCPILRDNGFEVIETDIDTLDITNENSVNTVFERELPDFVAHCAAYTNVDGAETDLKTALLINEKGTQNIAKACNKIGAALIYISTDYVFNGEKNEGDSAYLPEDAPDPINNYGLSKLKGEEAVKKHCKNYYIVRTSWLYGLNGKNFVETMIALAASRTSGEELRVVDDQIGCPTWTVDLAGGILKLIKEKRPYGPCGIYHLCGSGQTSWYGFAKEIFRQMDLNINLKPCTTDEFPRPAKRPKNSVMVNSAEGGGILRDWKVALNNYLDIRKRLR